MENYEAAKNDFIISTEKSKIDITFVHGYLCNESYWAKNIPIDIVKKSIEGSLCFSVYHHDEQIGFARVVTDHATFGYLADVFITEKFRGRGLSKWLMQCIMGHPQVQGFRRWMLATKDAHGLYAQFGFKPLDNPERIMRMSTFDGYPEASPKLQDPGEKHTD